MSPSVSALHALHAPVLITSTPALHAGTRLAFTVPAQPASQRRHDTFAAFDPGTRRWTPVPSSWNAARTAISAVIPHCSIGIHDLGESGCPLWTEGPRTITTG